MWLKTWKRIDTLYKISERLDRNVIVKNCFKKFSEQIKNVKEYFGKMLVSYFQYFVDMLKSFCYCYMNIYTLKIDSDKVLPLSIVLNCAKLEYTTLLHSSCFSKLFSIFMSIINLICINKTKRVCLLLSSLKSPFIEEVNSIKATAIYD